MSRQPPLDLHAHVDVHIDPAELTPLGVVFAATRSLTEAETALQRTDKRTVWGVGCHPGEPAAHEAFSEQRFGELMKRTAFVSEIGLDGTSPVSMDQQRTTLRVVLRTLQAEPRVVSLHSYQATEDILRELEETPIRGAVLHWWLGDADQTARAVRLGCHFSVNPSSVRRRNVLEAIPLDRVLPETDHPFGDRSSGGEARPGYVKAVELKIAQQHRLSPVETRALLWRNLADLVGQVGCARLLPAEVRQLLIASYLPRK